MKITIECAPKEIAALVLQLQERQEIRLNSRVELDGDQVSEVAERYIRGISAKSQPSEESEVN